MKNKIVFALLFLLFCQACSSVPRTVKPKELKDLTIWTKNIEEFVAYRGSIYKLERTLNDGIEYLSGEWSSTGTYIKAIDNTTKQEIWKYPIQADSITNLVFDETKIFFGTSVGMYYALDKKTGKEEWSYKSSKEIYDFNNIHKQSVIFRDYDSKLFSLDTQTGTLNWTFDLSSLFGADYSINSGPIYSSGILFFALNQNLLLGIDAETGTEKWRTEYSFKADDEFYLQNGYIVTMENTKFKKIDSNAPKEKVFTFEEVVNQDNRYINMNVFDIQTGSKLWSRKIDEIDEQKSESQIITKDPPLWINYMSVVYEQPPIFTKQRVYFNDRYLALHGFDLKTGKNEITIDLLPYHVIRKFFAPTLTIIDNTSYFLGTDATLSNAVLYALDLSKGKILWQKQFVNHMDAEFKNVGPYLFVTLSNNLFVLNKKNGNEIKNISIPFTFSIAEILKDSLIIITNTNPQKYATALSWK
jgi:outer membrane protein assembly factor BamB